MGANYTYYSTHTSGRLVLIYRVSFTAAHVARIHLHGLHWSSAFKLALEGKVEEKVVTNIQAERFLIYAGLSLSFPF